MTTECYEELKSKLLIRLQESLPVDAVLLALHGAAAADNEGDPEGDLLEAVRRLVGHDVPIVATLDLHAHVTRRMVEAADGLLAWETYPHRDALETGTRGARMVLDIVDGRLRPVMALAKVPIVIGAINGTTEGEGPFAETMRLAKQHEGSGTVYSTSAFLVHPYLDLHEMGGGGLVVTNKDEATAQRVARQIAEFYWSRRFDLEPQVYSPEDAIRRGLQDDGPVLLVETADCCGGGAAGDSVATLKALLPANQQRVALVPVVDPAAAAVCHTAGSGSSVTVRLGHNLDPKWGSPVEVTGQVLRLSDGKFTYRGGVWDGQIGDLGPAAVLRSGSIEILVASHPTYEWCGEQYEALQMDAKSAKFIVAKNPMNFHMPYDDLAVATYVLNTPGPTPATLRDYEFQNLQRPYFPLDRDIEDPVSLVVSSRKA